MRNTCDQDVAIDAIDNNNEKGEGEPLSLVIDLQ
jgi:hypothetical protein